MNFRLGLDIGIASVGWCMLDENDKIINAGVRLFPEAGADENITRRKRRASRRLLRRRHHRMERIRELLKNANIIDDIDYNFYTNKMTPYHYRVKGLNEKLTKNELGVALFHLIKRRGAQEFDIETPKNDKDEKGTKDILATNEQKLNAGKYICQVQLENFEKKGEIRGIENNFRTTRYIEEARKLLDTQSKFYPKEITKEFTEKFIKILEGRRKYYDGPGENSPYGWENEEEWMEKLMGKCTYFPEEIRIVKNCYTAEKFNLLNDFNNLTIKREGNVKLSKEEKLELIEVFKKNKKVGLKKIANTLNVSEENLSGYRTDEKGKAKFTELKSYIEINKILESKNIQNCDNEEILDEISKIVTYYQDTNNKKEKLGEIFKDRHDITGDIIEELAEKLNYTGSHSLSKKAIKLVEKDLLETTKNQMEIFTEMGLIPYKMDFKNNNIKYIPTKFLENWVVSSVVRRAIIQSIGVINQILKDYGIPNEIVIELAREKNSDEKQKKIKRAQDARAKENKEIEDLAQVKNLNGKFLELLKYWKKQDGVCMYSGESISIEDIKYNKDAFEIDHIIPRSVSFDDSQDNKVFVKRVENQKKGQRSPYEYFMSGESKRTYEEFKMQVNDMKSRNIISLRKRDLLLLEDEISKYSRNFISRNLVDTRYATRELMSLLKTFFRDKEEKIGKHVKIKSIKGSFTSQIRKEWDLIKMREVSHKHHAQDAYIVLMGEKIINKLKWVNSYNNGENKIKYNITTGEILSDEDYKKLFDNEYSKEIKRYKDFKYSYFIDKKPNRKLSDETIYSTRIVKDVDIKGNEIEEEYVIGKISNIYDENSKIKDFFASGDKQKQLLIYHNDRQTFEHMLRIFDEYKEDKIKKNPFFKYFKEYGKIKKYSKNGNGAEITNLKYRAHKLGNHLDISHKYKNNGNKKVIMESIPTFRADFYSNGKEYKFVSVRYLMLRDKGTEYMIDDEVYKKELIKKGITEDYKFKFSLNSGDIFRYQKLDGTEGKVRFKGVNNDETKKLEIDEIERNYGNYIEMIKLTKKEFENAKKNNIKYDLKGKMNAIVQRNITEEEAEEILNKTPLSTKQKFLTIGKDIIKVEKIYTNILGKEYISIEEFQKIIKK